MTQVPQLNQDPAEALSLDARPLEPTLPSLEERERIVIDMTVSLARCLREERARLMTRLAEVERDLDTLGARLKNRGRRRPTQAGAAGRATPILITSPLRAAETTGSETSSKSLMTP